MYTHFCNVRHLCESWANLVHVTSIFTCLFSGLWYFHSTIIDDVILDGQAITGYFLLVLAIVLIGGNYLSSASFLSDVIVADVQTHISKPERCACASGGISVTITKHIPDVFWYCTSTLMFMVR